MSRQHSIVPHKANYFYRILEDDYLLLYETLAEVKESLEKKSSGPSDCKAMIASVLENWMNSKRPSARCEEDLYVYLTYDEWESELRHRYGRSKIIHCLDEMEREGSYIDTEGKYGEPDTVYTGTIKKRHFIQNTFQYQLNLPVVIALLEALPEQSPFEQKARPSLGRPKKYRPEKNDINKNGLNVDDRGVKIDGQSVEVNDGSVKVNAPFYTHIEHTESYSSHIREESNSAHTDTDTFAPSLPLGALSLPQSIDTDYHSHQSVTDVSYSTPTTVSSAVTTRNEEGDDHAQPLQPLPTANHPDGSSGDVPSRHSQVNSTGFISPLDPPPVGSAQGSDVVGGEGQGEVAGRGGSTSGGTGAAGDTARGQVTEGDEHAHLPAGSARGAGALPGSSGDSHDAPMDDRHVVAPETGPVLEAGQEEEVNDGRTNSNLTAMALADTGHHLPGVPDYCHKETAVEQIAPREDVPVVAASPLTTSTVEPRESGEDTLPVAPVTEQPAQGQEGKRTGKRSRPPEKPKEVKPEPTADEIALQERCRRLYNRIVEWRGYAFDLKGAIINERTYVKRLAMKYASDELIEQIYVHLTTKDFKWSKPSFRFKVGAYELFTEAPSVIQQMKLNGTVDSDGAPHDANMIEWKGQWMSKEEAYQQGYLGGWERYKGQLLPDGRHPLDDELPMQGVK